MGARDFNNQEGDIQVKNNCEGRTGGGRARFWPSVKPSNSSESLMALKYKKVEGIENSEVLILRGITEIMLMEDRK